MDGTLSWRRLGVLVSNLQPGSCTAAAQDIPAQWGHVEHLLADLRELLRMANWQRGGDKHRPRPRALPRAGEEAAARAKARERYDRLMAQRRRLGR